MTTEDCDGRRSRVTRRRMLESVGGAGTLALAGCLGSDSSSTATSSGDGSVTIALTAPETGHYAPVGEHERDGFELAVRHLNEGGGIVDDSEYGSLSGDGVLGSTVETAVLDTEGSPATTESKVRPRLDGDEFAAVFGGVAGSVAQTNRDLADEYETPYFVGSSTVDALTGSGCSPHVYRHLFNSTTLARSLVSELASDITSQQSTFHVYADAPEGNDLFHSISDVVSRRDLPWRPTGGIAVRPGTTNFESAINEGTLSDVTLVFLDVFGLDAVNAIQWARDTLSEDTTVVVPYLTQSIADLLGDRVAGIYGTTGWHEDLGTPLAGTFGEAYQREYGRSDSDALVAPGPAQTVYAQVVLFAHAAERAGSFDATALRTELEGLGYAAGAGTQEMRACDHQSIRSVPIVRGRAQTESIDNNLELRAVKRGMEPGCEEPPASSCDL
ncbi:MULTISPECIES: ABC transporter substrate-binding protein [Halomicrobium]|nr:MULTISPECIES: ABC transporter substrate-binding protein [Halomicrobium]QCD66313.1 ABC transporter substrate-binding protein [Halomicrobium mukohataei]QFR21119.1 ABC transporter substrate-binding protein [Halomicrobium sp. ZPS1]